MAVSVSSLELRAFVWRVCRSPEMTACLNEEFRFSNRVYPFLNQGLNRVFPLSNREFPF